MLTKMTVLFKRFGIHVKFVTSDDPAAFAAAIDDKTKAIYVESIGNPKYNVSPIREIADVCSCSTIHFHEHKLILRVSFYRSPIDTRSR